MKEMDFDTLQFIKSIHNVPIYLYMRKACDVVTNGEYSKFDEGSGHDEAIHDPIVAKLTSRKFKIRGSLALDISGDIGLAIAQYHF